MCRVGFIFDAYENFSNRLNVSATPILVNIDSLIGIFKTVSILFWHRARVMKMCLQINPTKMGIKLYSFLPFKFI